MSKQCDLNFQQRSLFQQGYQRFSSTELKQLEWGLRFTPAACSLLTAWALYAQQPMVLLVVAALGMWAFFFPSAHPMDLLYNHLVRHLFGAVKLPANPFQRRLACFAAGIMNVMAASLFLLELPLAALITGGMLLVLQAIVIFTHFCTLSWMYEGLMRLLGKWHKPLAEESVREMVSQGANLVDVRSPNEFAAGSIRGAVNMPLENLHELSDSFCKKTPTLLFCNSGTRSHIACQKLSDNGLENIFNIGSFDRAKTLATAS